MRILRLVRPLVYAVASVLVLAQLALGAVMLFLQYTDHQVVLVTGGSMEPEYGVGDVVVLDAADRPRRVGDIVTYGTSVENLTTHRIIELVTVDDEQYMRTQGDANTFADPDSMPVASIVGTPVYGVPRAGVVVHFMLSPVGRMLTYGPILVLMVIGQITTLARNILSRGDRPGSAVASKAGQHKGVRHRDPVAI